METGHGIKYRQLHIEDYLREIPAEQGRETGEYAHERITGNPDTNTDFLPRLDHSGPGDGVCRQVDAHGAAGGEQDFRRFRRVDEPGHRFPRLFMRLRGKLAQVVGAAVHVGVLRFITGS